MVPELEKPRVTEIQVRMDCNGCVQKIKKALHGINGIYDIYFDFPRQKLTVIGWADPERIIKAIKKTRKIATICSHTEVTQPAAPQTEPPPEGTQPGPEAGPSNPPSAEAPPPAEAAPPVELPKDPPPPENPPPEPTPPPPTTDTNASQPAQPSRPKEIGEVHVVYHHPPDYGYRYGYGHGYNGYWNKYQNGQGPQGPQEPAPPVHVTHSYNTYKPSPYVTEYEYIRSPPQYMNYARSTEPSYSTRMDRYNEEPAYYVNGNNGNGNITSIFSDENPNACRIV
ncbi:hypothetical protein FNV43_RR00939 [Rhamnella rubrinervis]|uniref:HMA domain-containing protein n=1 Tax=Rhamnella rubrinervis TaxID=2594499 RepID=A0A8K0MSE5_9ROSA|nr:hypothetical protein FNV43_RR00939 [Rhamnella rubrinervis]